MRNVPVQGVHAVPQVVAAVQELDALPEVDVIIVARGGGGVEDLLPFSDEQLVRAVSAAVTPVVSAIGHEPDSPLLDLVADLRASTPTDAAKKVVPDVGEELARVQQLRERALRAVDGFLQREERGLAAALQRPCIQRPQRMVEDREEQVTALLERGRMDPGASAGPRRLGADAHPGPGGRALPKATLERGYAVLQKPDGTAVRSPGEVDAGDALRARVAEGEFRVRVDGVPGAVTPRIVQRQTLRVGDMAKAKTDGAADAEQGAASKRGGPGGVGGLHAGLRAGAGRADRGRPQPGGGRHDAGGVARAVGARRGAGEGLRRWLDGARARLDAALAEPSDEPEAERA